MESVEGILKIKGNQVWSLSPEATVFDAIALMAEKGVGALAVTDGPRLVGMISERDYARKVILQGKHSKDVRVREIMSAPVITVTSDHSVEECMRIATDHHIRHLPVLDGDRLAGMVSIGDLVKSIISQQAETIHHLTSYISGSYPG
jgi:CBS domain-containing protein